MSHTIGAQLVGIDQGVLEFITKVDALVDHQEVVLTGVRVSPHCPKGADAIILGSIPWGKGGHSDQLLNWSNADGVGSSNKGVSVAVQLRPVLALGIVSTRDCGYSVK